MLLQPNELKSKNSYKCLLYGQPGVGKTTLALSSSSPVLIDFEEGIYRVEKQYQVPTLQVKSFTEVIQFINSEEMKPFDTLIFDTLGRLIDCIIETLKIELKKSTISIKDWGIIKMKFNELIKTIYAKNKSIIFIAHELEEKDGDKKIKRPNTGSGSSGLSLINDMDLVGYMSMNGSIRTIAFTPTDVFYAKNSLQLEDNIEVDNTKLKGNVFFQEKIIKVSNEKLKHEAELREKYDLLTTIIKNNIESISNLEEVNNFINDFKTYDVIWDTKIKGWNLLQEKAKELKLTYNKETKLFEDLNVLNNNTTTISTKTKSTKNISPATSIALINKDLAVEDLVGEN